HVKISARPAVAVDIAGHRFALLFENCVNALPRIGGECGNSDEKSDECVCLQHARMIARPSKPGINSELSQEPLAISGRPTCCMMSSSNRREKTRPRAVVSQLAFRPSCSS